MPTTYRAQQAAIRGLGARNRPSRRVVAAFVHIGVFGGVLPPTLLAAYVTVPGALQVLRFQTRVLRDSNQHAWPKFLAIVESEHKVGPSFSGKGAMRTRLALLIPAELQQSGEDAPSLA